MPDQIKIALMLPTHETNRDNSLWGKGPGNEVLRLTRHTMPAILVTMATEDHNNPHASERAPVLSWGS